MKTKPATPEDIFRIAQKSPHVHAVVQEWRNGSVSWEEAMTWAVLLLNNINEKLAEAAVTAAIRKPPEPIVVTGLSNTVETFVGRALDSRNDMLEWLGAAFCRETGLDPRECELVEEQTATGLRWHYRKREGGDA